MAYYETQTTQAIGCTACSGLGEYEAHVVGHVRLNPRLRYARAYSGLGGPIAVSGIGETPAASASGESMCKSIGYAAVGAGAAWLLAYLGTKAFSAQRPKEVIRNTTLLGAAVGLFASV